jgi:hypothetical protein
MSWKKKLLRVPIESDESGDLMAPKRLQGVAAKQREHAAAAK